MKFKHLFEPLELQDLLLRNRITMSAMPTGYSCTKGYVTRKMVSYYANRAKGGASLIVVEGAAIEDTGKVYLSHGVSRLVFLQYFIIETECGADRLRGACKQTLV